MSALLRTLSSLPTIVTVVLAGVGLSLAVSSPGSASAGQEFGHHVQTCTQGMGFDGDHNPGMHTGYAGWDPAHVC